MPKTDLIRWCSRGGVPALLMVITVGGSGQDQPKTSEGLIPKEQMMRAATHNGLMGADMPPWHIKASFTEFGDDGNTSNSGTYEEFWVSQTKFKRILAGNGFSQTIYGSAKGDFQSDVHGHVPLLVERARLEFTAPLPSIDLVRNGSFAVKEIETNGVKLECLRSDAMPVNPDVTYCISVDRPLLRVSSSASQQEQVLHNRILGFRDRFIAGDLQFIVAGKRNFTAHLETVEPLQPADDAMFAPPADAVPIPRTVINAALAQGMLLRKVTPTYPPFALHERITGTVVLEATIGTDGHVRDLKAVSGPSELRTASLEAVHQWLYRPYLLNGEPVSVQTTINVIFALGQ